MTKQYNFTLHLRPQADLQYHPWSGVAAEGQAAASSAGASTANLVAGDIREKQLAAARQRSQLPEAAHEHCAAGVQKNVVREVHHELRGVSELRKVERRAEVLSVAPAFLMSSECRQLSVDYVACPPGLSGP